MKYSRHMQQSANLTLSRYNQLVKVFTKFYMTHPDADVYAPEYRVVLAKCAASKVAYGVSYDEDIELTIKRFNQWRGGAAQPH